ncbi:fibronectin type III domain-containing protein [Isoptericola aurantiacus]|uniref:fibronectin type III domain-containing protein n=1 Tax=Isoptericola aurantiacus TaxID=3377839 RepID=UPI00383BAEC4
MTPSRHRPSTRRARTAATVVLAAALAVGATDVAAGAATPTDPQRVTLTPTTTPATSQTITWRTAEDTPAVVQHAPAAGGTVTTTPGTGTGRAGGGSYHRATLTGLEPGETYRYRVGDGVTWSDWYELTTADAAGEPFEFLYFGDVQNDITAGAAPVVRAAYAAVPDAKVAVHAGDLINHADDDDEWDEWFAAQGDGASTVNHVTAIGNHEYDDWDVSTVWDKQFPGTGNGPGDDDLDDTVWYTDYQGVRFVALNSNYTNAPWFDVTDWMEDQEAWLDGVLADNPNEWTVVAFHQPVFANSEGRSGAIVRRFWLDVLEEHDVDLVLQGHDHSYGRGGLRAHETSRAGVTTGPVYVVSVTGPKMYEPTPFDWNLGRARVRTQLGDTQTYQVVSVDGDQLTYEARTVDGDVVDAFEIDRSGGQKVVRDR